MEREDAIGIARAVVERLAPDGSLAVVTEPVTETDDLIELRYDSRAFVETAAPGTELIGGGSIIVDRRDGLVYRTGSLLDDRGAVDAIVARHRSTPAPDQLSATADRLWVRLPWKLARRLTLPGLVMADGRYLASYGPAAVGLPVAALVVGLVLGARPWTDELFTFTESIGIVGALLALGVLGGALGVWTTIGYAVGELFLARTPPLGVLTAPGWEGRVREQWPGWFVSYLVLLLVVAVVPVLADGARRATRATLRRLPETGSVLGDVVFVVVVGLATWAWCVATAYLIRGAFVFREADPTLEAVATVQTRTGALVVLAMVVAAGRIALERVGAGHPVVPRSWAMLVPPTPAVYPVPVAAVGLVLLALLQTMVLRGVIASWAQFAVVFAGFAVALVAGHLVLPSTRWAGAVRRVPRLVRFVAVVGIGLLVAYPFVAAAYAPGANQKDFAPFLVGVVVSALAAGVLLPALPRARPRRPS